GRGGSAASLTPAGPQPATGQGGRWQPVQAARPGEVSLDLTEALRACLPLLTEARDLDMVAADEGPPHDDLLAVRLAPEQHEPHRLGSRLEHQGRDAGVTDGQVADGEGTAVDDEVAGVEQHAVLVCGIDLDLPGCPRVEVDLGAEEWGEGPDGGVLAGQR